MYRLVNPETCGRIILARGKPRQWTTEDIKTEYYVHEEIVEVVESQSIIQ